MRTWTREDQGNSVPCVGNDLLFSFHFLLLVLKKEHSTGTGNKSGFCLFNHS